jgi:murein DD-endopeptidase MepM/ murein hydrolase activator NlpD
VIPWRAGLAAAVAVAALQGCEMEPPRTTVLSPGASLPDDTVLKPRAAAAPQAQAPQGPQQAAAASAGETSIAPAEPAPPAAPQADATAAGAGSASAPPQAAADAAAPAQGTAAPTELSAAPPPAAAASAGQGPDRQASAGGPAVRNAGDARGAQALAQRSLLMPVVGVPPSSLRDQYEDGRGKRDHEAIDILATRGTPVVAVDDGRIAKLFTSRAGGLTVYQFDGSQQLSYYYAHLDRYAPGLKEGMDVRRGDLIGYVGTSGNADKKTPHLHFAVFRLDAPPRWWEGEPVNPYPALSRAAPSSLQVASR